MIDSMIGLGLVLFMAGLIVIHVLPRRAAARRGKAKPAAPAQARRAPIFRSIPAINQLRRSIGLSVEEGKRLHVSLGRSSIISPNAASALAGLAALERIAQMSIISDRPPIATSGEGSLTILSQDTLRAAYRMNNAIEQYDPIRGRMTGPTDFSYVAGAIPVIQHEEINTNILLGSFGPSVGLLTEASDRAGAFSLAGSNDLPAQAVIYAAAEQPLIGEEIFAVPAYLNAGPAHSASLRAQDVVRWLLIVVIVVASILTVLSTMFGITLL